MNARFSLLLQALVAAGFAAPLFVHADVPPVDAQGKGALVRCNTTAAGEPVWAAHADKIIFKLLPGAMPAADPNDQAALNAVPRNMELDIKVLDDPRTVADLRGKVLSFLGAVDNGATRGLVKIIDVDYSMVCPVKPPPAGAAEF